MEGNQVKHLEMIQAVVNRLASNSFAYKAWAVALVSALFAFGASTSRPLFVAVAVLPAAVFWSLDTYYLLQERYFRSLFDAVRTMPNEQWSADPFSMNTMPYRKPQDTWVNVAKSGTVMGLYLPLLITVVVVFGLAVAASFSDLFIPLSGQCGRF